MLGSAVPHLFSFFGGADWRVERGARFAGGHRRRAASAWRASLGPHHEVAAKLHPRMITAAWTNRRVRLAYAGYLGHMWELYAMWAWIGGRPAASPMRRRCRRMQAEELAKLTAFLSIAAGGVVCGFAGLVADRIGKANLSIIAMVVSGACALLTAATFGGPVWLTFALVMVWGATIVPDSPQFSALVADASPAEQAGSLLTFQTALGFGLTIATVQLTPLVAAAFGWPLLLALLALGPAFGIVAMLRLRAMGRKARCRSSATAAAPSPSHRPRCLRRGR